MEHQKCGTIGGRGQPVQWIKGKGSARTMGHINVDLPVSNRMVIACQDQYDMNIGVRCIM